MPLVSGKKFHRNVQKQRPTPPPILDDKFIEEMLTKTNYKKRQSTTDARLPCWEIALSFAFWIANAVYAIYLVYRASVRYRQEVDPYRNYFVIGWNLFSLNKKFPKDEANYEWRVFKNGLQTLLICLIVHSIVFRLLERVFVDRQKILRFSMFILWIFLHVVIYGFFAVVVTSVHGLLMLISARLFRRVFVIWITACSLLFTLALEWYGTFDFENTFMYSFAVFIAYKLLQYVSFCFYDIYSTQSVEFHVVLYDMFAYALYLPYSCTLIVPYKEFCRQERERCETSVSYPYVVFLALRVAFWTIFNDFILHFLYMNSMMVDDEFLYRIDPATLSSIGYVAGQFFHTKYMSIFGVNTIFAYLDGMQPPWPPICISRVAFYSQMWRYFDRGLYSFLRDMLFVPIAYPDFTFKKRLAATFTCFAFVWLWHGTSLAFLFWVSMNFAEVMLENITGEILRLPAVDKFVVDRFSPVNRRRLASAGSIVCVAWGILAIFFFLGDYAGGKVFITRLFGQEFLSYHFFYLIILGYFYGNCCSEIELWYRQRNAAKHGAKSSDKKAA